MNVGEITGSPTPSSRQAPRIRVVFPAPSSPDTSTTSPGRSSAASRAPIPSVSEALALRSAVNLDFYGRSDPYYVSIDLGTARHPQTLLATHFGGRPLPLAHGAPLRLLAPMKLGLKNIKAITDIAYTAAEPSDYWNEQGYSKYDGL